MELDRIGAPGIPILWQALAQKYQFNFPKDWYKIEAHWLDQIESFQEQPVDCPGRDAKMNNSITRISQCNESYQLCNSLPQSFIVPKDLKDFTLINNLSTLIKDHRVPVISYCCPIEYKRTFIIRSASFDHQSHVIDTLKKVVKPLQVLHLSSIAPGLEKVESAHKKMRDACRPGNEESINKFLSKTGKWLRIISKTLKIAKETANTVQTESSVILVEGSDNNWNNVISSLIQVTLEPHRRTMEGLESLISKEWIYLAGTHDYSKSDVMFILFLDCVYQLYIQNQRKFEFTSEYLRYLFEAQYIHNSTENGNALSSFKRGANGYLSKFRRSKLYSFGPPSNGLGSRKKIGDIASYKSSSIDVVEFCHQPSIKRSTTISESYADNVAMLDSDGKKPDLNSNETNGINNANQMKLNNTPISKFEGGYNRSMINPFYEVEKNESPLIAIYDSIINIKLWSSLYLRWQSTVMYGCVEESMYLKLVNE